MKRRYCCPKCKALLNPGTKIILTARSGEKLGLVLFSPQPGNYNAIVPDELMLKPGDLVELRCPVCGASLDSRYNENLAHIDFVKEDGEAGQVNFSRRFGERATYFVTSETIRSYGPDAARYGGFNFFGESVEKE